ncbi:hypothetical protein PVK06_042010 [Gossypium arboreum]|uniref:Uncharacterized protein n=1 Tax=Gossypium arboreum TaxID=29729 RepID=A0ABR0NA37_GOSAR|nr:hypothetical protein PVK06_042010 [Gossypium arboreum]
MEDFRIEDLEWDTLKKWGATLNMAKQLGFQVVFADNLLKTKLLAYFATQKLLDATEKKSNLNLSSIGGDLAFVTSTGSDFVGATKGSLGLLDDKGQALGFVAVVDFQAQYKEAPRLIA